MSGPGDPIAPREPIEPLEGLERLLRTLLYEGYALYPYTPGATKNATPTPFGIVYPPVYAARSEATFDHLELRCVLEAPTVDLAMSVRFLTPEGERHRAIERRVELSETGEGDFTAGAVRGRVRLGMEPLGGGRALVIARVENHTPIGADVHERAEALRSALVSTHVVVRAPGGRFLSPLETGAEAVSTNTFPVLATPADDVVLGAAIVLPDHPQIAPESLGDLFDGTEIEEALLLHVQTLSDAERASIADQDPAVRAMIARAQAAAPADLVRLHGRIELRDPEPDPLPGAFRPGPDGTRRVPGEERLEVAGVTFVRGGKVELRPGTEGDPYDRMLHGRTATIERILIDYDDRVHLGVTVDDDPGQGLMRDTGRYLFFFPHQVEVRE